LERTLRNARLIQVVDTERVGIGTKVKLMNLEDDEEAEYIIVGSAEAEPAEHKISYESPVGKALLNKRVGDEVEIKVPAGVVRYRVVSMGQ
jgi:transcription elongation factor GreA